VHPNVDHIHHQHLVNCVIYCVFGHKTQRVWYVTIMSHGIVYISDTHVMFKHISNTGTLCNVMSHTWCIRCQTALGASRARWLIDGSGANKRSFTLSSKHTLRLRHSVVDCITLCYIGLLDI